MAEHPLDIYVLNGYSQGCPSASHLGSAMDVDRLRANRGAFLQIGFLISGQRGVAQGGKFFSPNSIWVCNQLDCNQSIHQCKKNYRFTVSPDLSDNNPDNSSFYPLAPIFTLKHNITVFKFYP
ncbi:Uncharacterized protein APZ42_008045 [Daphnia magna]|uniref:Uncharacterized protein n=1 Tax=Daphnia magna TaxID=35525 RepID=A0A162BTE5_9CRUS|nr:Uncharacterized protein APZ42_008045 [Daphnia magna]